MKLNIYSIYDDTAKAYMQPFFLHNHALAVRAFTDQVNSENNNPLSIHPEQFTLYHVGEFNDQTGNLELREHQSLGKGISYKKETDQDKSTDQIIKELKSHIDSLLAFNTDIAKLKEIDTKPLEGRN